jgi:hypothetical protein
VSAPGRLLRHHDLETGCNYSEDGEEPKHCVEGADVRNLVDQRINQHQEHSADACRNYEPPALPEKR